MRQHRLYIDQQLNAETELVLDKERSHYLARVLRVATGQTIIIFDGHSNQFEACIGQINTKTITLFIQKPITPIPEAKIRISLIQAISRGERMDYSLQKATELGVTEIWPVFSERTEVRLTPQRLEKRYQHWTGVIISACEQSGRADLPTLHQPSQIAHLESQPFENQLRVMAHPNSQTKLNQLKPELKIGIVLAVGPEGGFSDLDLENLQQKKFQSFSLGPRVLRSETAGPAAIAAFHALWGDFT